jgi:hypothetical protein
MKVMITEAGMIAARAVSSQGGPLNPALVSRPAMKSI